MIIKKHSLSIFAMIFVLCGFSLTAQRHIQNNTIVSGAHWFDNNGKVVSAHGAGILKEGSKYYLFGELKSDTGNAFVGFSCYSSQNLADWTFEKIALPQQESGKLGPQRVGERPKVMKCPSTGEYVMYMHTDNLKYKDQCVGYATSNKINGEYTFQGVLLFDGKPIKKWDMGVFQDTDGKGYLITHSGNLYQLSNDYKSVTRQVVEKMTPHCEAPVIFKKDSIYYWIGSGLTGWERNDNYYFTATSLEGPWISQGTIAPEGSLTWNSQSTYVLPVAGSNDTTYIFMGDRWSHPKQRSSATYVWQPLKIDGYSLSMPVYHESWQIDVNSGQWNQIQIKGKECGNVSKKITYKGNWTHASDNRSDEKGASCSFSFKGTQMALQSTACPDGGYALLELFNSKGENVLSTTIDMYCKYAETSVKFLSPKLPKDTYTCTVLVMGEHWSWVEKSGRKSGSTGDFVSLDKIIVAK